jgi:hypothetical protein
VQAVLAHQVGADARQVTLVGAREALVQQAGHRQVEHGVAEEFEALVVLGAAAAVGERTQQQARLLEPMTEPLLQGVESGIHQRGAGLISATALRT